MRVRMLALAAAEELSVGEVAELLGESQPNVSRHAAALRKDGLLLDRREGTRVFVRLARPAADDAVVADALATGRRLCEADGSLARVRDVVRVRDQHTREFFSRPSDTPEPSRLANELPGYLFAVSAAIGERALAVDAGTGDGAWLDILAPMFDRVVALDRSQAQLDQARRRVAARGYDNVTLVCSELDGAAARQAAAPGADLITCSRVLHHSPLPRDTVRALAGLARPGGRLVILDYLPHGDERLQEQQADVWMGFDPDELLGFARDAGCREAGSAPARITTWTGRSSPRGVPQLPLLSVPARAADPRDGISTRENHQPGKRK
jgi:DNA-binding transcriptional ArsR family regulator